MFRDASDIPVAFGIGGIPGVYLLAGFHGVSSVINPRASYERHMRVYEPRDRCVSFSVLESAFACHIPGYLKHRDDVIASVRFLDRNAALDPIGKAALEFDSALSERAKTMIRQGYKERENRKFVGKSPPTGDGSLEGYHRVRAQRIAQLRAWAAAGKLDWEGHWELEDLLKQLAKELEGAKSLEKWLNEKPPYRPR
jgi:hypothetical protein